MTEKDIVRWYSDLNKTSWIFPENSRTVNLMSEDEEIMPIVEVVEKCKTCFFCCACFKQLCTDGIYKENHYTDFLNSPICEEYICAEEVNGKD
jgi:hypothetical protein